MITTVVDGYANKPKKFAIVSLEEAKNLSTGDQIWFIDREGKARRAKISGMPHTWKRDLARVEVPYKYGLYSCSHFNEQDIEQGMILKEIV